MAPRILRAGPVDLDLVRATRLRALADSPDAFWTTEAQARAQPRSTWHDNLADPNAATFVAVDDLGAAHGLVFGSPHHDRPGQAGLYGMWVAPEARRSGTGRRLIAAVIEWARATGHPQLLLEVADTNAPAIAAYRALGFTPTGRRGAMPPPREHIREHELALRLRADIAEGRATDPRSSGNGPVPDPVGPGQTSVWDFPRPPRIERDTRRAVLRHGGVVVADTDDLVKVLETSHPPTYYLPRAAFGAYLRPADRRTFCEWKGAARYVDVVVPGAEPLREVGWWYPDPNRIELRDRVAVYAGPFERITLDGEPVTAQPGGFYGGWITADLAGPFKGSPGTLGW